MTKSVKVEFYDLPNTIRDIANDTQNRIVAVDCERTGYIIHYTVTEPPPQLAFDFDTGTFVHIKE